MLSVESAVSTVIQIDRASASRAQGQWRVDLWAGGELSGTVTDERGDPVSGALVEVASAGGTRHHESTSDERGGWRITGIPEGIVRYRASPPPARTRELNPAHGETDVREGLVTRETDIRLEWRR